MKSATKQLKERPPIVVIVGHIDHGKSTLLDYIRKTNVVATEAGGITQHTRAYEVIHQNSEGDEKKITFLDTPGHEAFSAMRQRGAAIADIAVLVVSAEEGVKAQTLEALKSIEEAAIPYIVAINKIDRPNANIERIKQNLGESNIFIEEHGGKVPCLPISAKTGQGVSELLDLVLLVAALEELTGDPLQAASGYVLESHLDAKSGVLATLVITGGTLRTGDYVVVGGIPTKIKKLADFLGQTVAAASFSSPVQVLGWASTPPTGFPFRAFGDKKEAGQFAAKEAAAPAVAPVATAPLAAGAIEIPIVIKADTLGTLEAVEKEIRKLAEERASLKIIGRGVGPISENDLKLASGATDPLIIGFQVKIDKTARDLAEKLNLVPHPFEVIYKLTEWLSEEIQRRLPKIVVEETGGKVKILKYFSTQGDKQIVGGEVFSGRASRGKAVKIIRRGAEVGRGKIMELQQQLVSTSEIEAGNKGGLMVESKLTIAPGDVLEVLELVEK